MSEPLEYDPVFLGLTRPPMFRGVGYNWLILTGIGCALGFLLVHPAALLIYPLFHLLGMALYAKDPHLIDCLGKRFKVGWTPNRAFWHGNSYRG